MIDDRDPRLEGSGAAPAARKLFIVGCARSGTTWVSSILSQHPAVVRGPESHLFPVLSGALGAADHEKARKRALAAFDRRVEERREYGNMGPHRWISRDAFEELLSEAEQEAAPGEETARYVLGQILDRYFAREGGTDEHLLVEKTPLHLFDAERILEWWPEASILEVVRDGRDVCVSLAHKSAAVGWAPADREAQIARWVRAVRAGLEMRSSPLARGRWHLLRYEDLTAEPVGEIQRLYAFAGLAADEQLARRVADDTSIEKARRAGDTHHIRRGGVGGWRDEFSESDTRRFEELGGELLAAHGYDRSAAS